MTGSIRNFEKLNFTPKSSVFCFSQGQTSEYDRLAQFVFFCPAGRSRCANPSEWHTLIRFVQSVHLAKLICLCKSVSLAHFFLYSFQNLNLKKNKRKHGTGLIKFLGTFTDKQGRI